MFGLAAIGVVRDLINRAILGYTFLFHAIFTSGIAAIVLGPPSSAATISLISAHQMRPVVTSPKSNLPRGARIALPAINEAVRDRASPVVTIGDHRIGRMDYAVGGRRVDPDGNHIRFRWTRKDVVGFKLLRTLA